MNVSNYAIQQHGMAMLHFLYQIQI